MFSRSAAVRSRISTLVRLLGLALLAPLLTTAAARAEVKAAVPTLVAPTAADTTPQLRPPNLGPESDEPLADGSEQSRGKPTVKLDHLGFPAMLGGQRYEKFLRKALAKEVLSVDWGASSDSTIEYRFFVTELTVQRKGDALLVKCSASGRLPRGQSAKSQLSFGGDPAKHSQLIERVLGIVARGVISRLAEIERVRRGELNHARVPAPSLPVD
ncbi:MAG: hypothetical protein RJA70_3737 [Pseudomonadota bacterium]|jgi:hypothetical protein